MSREPANDTTPFDKRFLSMAIVLGIVSGLVEGLGHLGLQRLHVLDNTWYEIVWIAAFFNCLLLLLVGLILRAGFPLLPTRIRSKNLIAFALALAALVPCVALMLKEWLKAYAILILAIGLATVIMRWFSRSPETRLHLFRRCLPWAIAAAVLACVGIQGKFWLTERLGLRNLPQASASAPDVLVIIIDALRADHLSTYGYARSTSPNIDRIASEGLLFEHAFAAASYTLPSHASLVTGLYPHDHGVEWLTSKELARRNIPTIGSALQRHGYRTAAFSGNTFWFSREHGFDQGFLHFEDYFQSLADMVLRTAYGRIVSTLIMPKLGYEDIAARKHARDTNKSVLRWLGDSDSNPFFVFINYMDVHDPYLPPQPYRSKYSSEKEPGGLINWQLHIPETLTPEQLQSEIDAYDGAIAYVDDQVEALIKALKQRQTSRDLLVIITSDHGEEFKEHGGLTHGHNLYRETIQVPLIFWQPGRVPSGVRIPRPVSNSNIAATIMSMVGAAGALPGTSLDRLWGAAESANDWGPPLSELKERAWTGDRYPVHYGSLRSVVTPEFHCIEYKGPRLEVYDWKADAAEKTNLAEAANGATLTNNCRRSFEKSSAPSNP